MKVKVFLAAPIEAGFATQFDNIANAIDAAEEVIALKAYPYVPQLTSLWQFLRGHDQEFWIDYDFEFLKTCDVVWRLTGRCSRADAAVEDAADQNIPVVYTYAELCEWMVKKESSAHLTLVDESSQISSSSHSDGET